MIKRERQRKSCKEYYEGHKISICQQRTEDYIPRSIKKIGDQIPEKVARLYDKYPYDIYGEPYIKRKLRNYGIRRNGQEYDECYDLAMLGYMYSVARCAYMDYDHVENYIKCMIKYCISMGLIMARKEYLEMKSQNFRMVYLDDEENLNRF